MKIGYSGIGISKVMGVLALLATVLIASLPQAAMALPLFARQTGQNCMACHAGGQFPELTPYGRMFKITGYTIGERTSAPVSVMGVVASTTVANTSKSDDPGADFQNNGQAVVATASVFLGGKITDNIGAFVQVTNDPNATSNNGQALGGQTNADNMDFRYADRFVNGKRDLVVGVSVNNNPSVSDPWNTAAAWMQYVPVPSTSSSQFVSGAYHGYGSGGNVAGVSAYAYWNQMVYAELGGYSTARGLFSFMSAGLPDDQITRLNGVNPYWRLALNREWGPHSLMVGTAGMISQVYDNPQDTSDPATLHQFRDVHFDAQYQYLLDPHSVTGQLVFAHQTHQYPGFLANQSQPLGFVDANGNPLPLTNAEDTTDIVRAKLTYVYRAKYGGSLGFFNLTGSTNTANQTSGYDPATMTITSLNPAATALSTRVGGNLSGNPATRGWTYEAFWMPTQNVRVGAQYTAYQTYNGASQNYDGLGRNAEDNNSLFFYLWAAF